MNSRLTMELKKYGFLCGIELKSYVLDTGRYTSLFIEGHKKESELIYHYNFYKQTFYPHYPNKVTVYGEHLLPAQLLKRVERYFINRKRFLSERST